MTRRRTLAVQIDEIAIGDGEIVPPSLGHVIEFPIRFVEQPSTADTVTIRALLEASNRDPIFQYTGHDSPRRWEWNGLLRGDGWTASWRGFTPRTGHVELTGRFYGVMGYDTPSYVRGRVTRVQLVSERYRRPPESHGWNIVPGHRTLRDVEAPPRFFDNDMFMRDDLFEVDRAVGVVVDLDLDDVPPVPPRPTIVPGDVSASGEMLWVIDSQLPAVVSIDPNRVAHEYVLPGPIGHSRHVWATPTGCWVGGHDGLYRCVIGEEPRKIFDRPVPQGAAIGEHFLACPSAATWPLYNQDNEPVEVDVPDGYVRSIAVDGESFVVLAEQRQTDAASTYRLIRVSVSGDVIVGPELRPSQVGAGHRRTSQERRCESSAVGLHRGSFPISLLVRWNNSTVTPSTVGRSGTSCGSSTTRRTGRRERVGGRCPVRSITTAPAASSGSSPCWMQPLSNR